jgi:murein DD-endopeptidase MepM/ murein hydrolase activator NlpD
MRTTLPESEQSAPPVKRPPLSPVRHRLLLAALATASLLVSIPTPSVSASASVLHRELVIAAPQHIDVPLQVQVTVPVRESYDVSYFTVVQSPVPSGTVISSPFGYRAAPCATCSTYHEGVDYLAAPGSKVPAIADGTVVEVGNPSGNRGVYAIIRHDVDGVTWYSSYSHLEWGSMHLAVGHRIKRGHTVGRVGSTGQSTGAHLFFQILDANDQAVDPVPWLAKHVND